MVEPGADLIDHAALERDRSRMRIVCFVSLFRVGLAAVSHKEYPKFFARGENLETDRSVRAAPGATVFSREIVCALGQSGQSPGFRGPQNVAGLASTAPQFKPAPKAASTMGSRTVGPASRHHSVAAISSDADDVLP